MAAPPSFTRPLPIGDLDAEPLTTELVDVGDDFESLAKLFGLPRGASTRIISGELQFQASGVTYRLQKVGSPAPTAASSGVKVGVDSSRTFNRDDSWRLDACWVRETTPAGGAKVIFSGWVV